MKLKAANPTPVTELEYSNVFELLVAVLQAYIFTILCCIYLNDSLHLH